MKLKSFVSAAVLSITMAGCASMGPTLIRATNPTYCPPEEAQQALYTMSRLNYVDVGQSKQEVLSMMGPPNHWEQFLLKDRRQIDVMFYKAGSPDCRHNPTRSGYIPMVFHGEKLVGYGEEYYNSFILPEKPQTYYTPPQGVNPPWERTSGYSLRYDAGY